MASPRQRIKDLKKEIAQLDHQMLQPVPSKPRLNLPLKIVSFKQDQHKEEMQQKLNSMRLNTTEREQTLTSQLAEIQQKLKILAKKKQSELTSSKSIREKQKQQIENLKNALQKCKDCYQIATAEALEKQRIKENSAFAKERVYSESLVPLECDAKELGVIREELSSREVELSEEIRKFENLKMMCREDMRGKEMEKVESVMVREEIEANLQFLMEEFSDEIEYLKNDDEFFKAVSGVVGLQGKYTEEMCGLEASKDFNLVAVQKIQEKIKSTGKELENILTNADNPQATSEINKLERMISQSCRDMNVEPLENVILELNALERFEIDEEILKLQLLEVKKVESQYREEFEWEEKEFSELLIIKNYENNPIGHIENAFLIKKKRYRNRLAAICQWKDEVESFISDPRPRNSIFLKDSTILQEFLASLCKVPSLETKRKFEGLITTYYKVLSNRDKVISNSSLQIQEKSTEKNKLSQLLQKKNSEGQRLNLEIIRIRQQIQLLVNKEKLLKKDQKPNEIINWVLALNKQISKRNNLVFSASKQLEMLQLIIAEFASRSKACERETAMVKISQREITEEFQAVQYQIEKICDKKIKNSIDSSFASLDEFSIVNLRLQMDETSKDLEVKTQELLKVESDYQYQLSLIEQEEAMLRSQHQAIESALRNVEMETKRIKEMVSHLVKFDDTDAAPNPETLKEQNRSKSAARFIKPTCIDDFYTSELKDGEEGSCIVEGNTYMEVVVKSLGHQPSIITDRVILVQPRAANKKYYRFNLEDTSPQEKMFLEKIMPLLEGTELYKKISVKNPVKNSAFDPLDALKRPPESFGFALRQFRLHKSLKIIDVKQILKPGFESRIFTDTLLAPIIAPNVMVVLKLQNHLNNDDLDYDKLNEKFTKTSYLDVNTEAFKEKCRECTYYPFKICVGQGEKIELIAKGYQGFKHWINGINALIKYKKLIPRIRSRIEAYTTV